MMTKTRAHLPALEEGSNTYCDDEDGTEVTLDRKVWTAMGEPATVTVTVQPGNHLTAELAARSAMVDKHLAADA